MSQVHWIYKPQDNRCHEVSIYHGDTSGHVVLYCNTSIVKIDFGVFDTKHYAFMIDDELFEVSVIKKALNSFDYQLRHQGTNDIVLPHRIDSDPERKAKKIILIGFGLIALLLGGIGFYFFF